ncbi:MAG: hypothetical protein ABI619_08480 [Betaproteobacteria bacterium]
MPEADRLYEPAAPDALLCVGGGKTLYIGSRELVDWPHFAHHFRVTFSVTPSYVFRKIGRCGSLAGLPMGARR